MEQVWRRGARREGDFKQECTCGVCSCDSFCRVKQHWVCSSLWQGFLEQFSAHPPNAVGWGFTFPIARSQLLPQRWAQHCWEVIWQLWGCVKCTARHGQQQLWVLQLSPALQGDLPWDRAAASSCLIPGLAGATSKSSDGYHLKRLFRMWINKPEQQLPLLSNCCCRAELCWCLCFGLKAARANPWASRLLWATTTQLNNWERSKTALNSI